MKRDRTQIITRIGKYLLAVYAVVSVVYTAHYFYSSYDRQHHGIQPRAREAFDQEPIIGMTEPQLNEHAVVWSNGQGAIQSLPENYVMTKVFSGALGPSNLTPYFYRAKEPFDKEDITMATLVTRNRFPVLSRLASNHKGPISAAVHISDDETKDIVMKELRELYAQNPDMQRYVDVHLILDKYDRQFNMWRNVAKLFSRTDYIMMLDVDFHLCTDLRKSIRSDPDLMRRLREGRTALVVPAFEYNVQEDGTDWRTFPTNKKDLLKLKDEGKIDMFHKSWVKGHGSTDYPRWYRSNKLYKVTTYDFSYEPYIVYKKEGSPWCDERFIGYGANKAACLYEIYLSGIEYWVLPNDFLIHQTHRYPEETRKKERQYNRELYSHFREEVCIRYARKFYASGEWDTPRADNLKRECQNIRRFETKVKNTIE